MTPALFAIDSSIYIFRSFFSLQPRWHSMDGMATEAVYGYAAFLLRLLQREKPRYIAAAFDKSLETGFRHLLYPGYKANRALPDEALAYQLHACERIAEVLGIACHGCENYEADDYLAAIAKTAHPGQQVYIVSRDKDLAQLLSPTLALWDYGYSEPISIARYSAEKGLDPTLVPDLLALSGDASDNIPGVPGIGVKTATAILNALGAIEDWLDDPSRLAGLSLRGAGKLPHKIAPYREQILLAKQLTSLRADMSPALALAQLRWRGIAGDEAESVFLHYGLKGLLKSLEKVAAL